MRLYAAQGQPLILRSYGSVAGVDLSASATILIWEKKGYRLHNLSIDTHTASSDRSVSETASSGHSEGLGEVVAARVHVESGAAVRGSTYVILTLGEDGPDVIRGYVTATHDLALGDFENSVSGQGRIHSVSLGNPAAGAEYAQTVPTGALWRILTFAGQLVTAANAQDRMVNVEYTDGTNVVGRGFASVDQTASLTQDYSGLISGIGHTRYEGINTPASGSLIHIALPNTKLHAGWVFDFATKNFAAGDDWGAGYVTVEEWIDI